MDHLRREDDDHAAFEDDVAEFDRDVLDRLSAYGADTVARELAEVDSSAEPPSWIGEPAELPALAFGVSRAEEVVEEAEVAAEETPSEVLSESDAVPPEADAVEVATGEEAVTVAARFAVDAKIEPETEHESIAADGPTVDGTQVNAVEASGLALEAAREQHDVSEAFDPTSDTVVLVDEPQLEQQSDGGAGAASESVDDDSAADVAQAPEHVRAEDGAVEGLTIEVQDGREPEPAPRRRFAIRRRRDEVSPEGPKRAGKAVRGPSKDKKARRLVGLKIGASQIAAAQVVNNGAPELVDVYREPLESGLVVSGEIRDPSALGAALKRFFDLHKLPKKGVRLGLSNNRIGVRIFEIDGVADPQQLENAIRFRAEEVLPIPLDQAVLDYVVLEDAEREDGTPWKRILLVVAYREVVDRYLQACREAGIDVVGIDLEAFALLRSLEAPAARAPEAGALVAVAIGHDRTTIAVSTGQFCEFTRVLDWGGWSVNVAIARELDRAPSEVEAIKRHLSFSHETEVEGLTPEQVRKARDAAQRALAAFARELVASLQFYQAQPGALGIGEVVLTGGAAHMDGLAEALGAVVGVPIRLGDPFKRIKVGPKVELEAQRGSVAIAIGLGIDD